MAELPTIKKSISAIKCKITKILRKEIGCEDISDATKIKLKLASLTPLREQIEILFDQANDIEISSQAFDEPAYNKKLEEQIDYLFDIDAQITAMKQKVAEDEPVIVRQVEEPLKSVSFTLPSLNLPCFESNGRDPCAFIRFQAAIQNAITGAPGLNESQKFLYLKAYLRGKASSMVEGIPCGENAFKEALELLEKEFLDKELIIQQILSSIINYRDVNSPDDVENFISFLRYKCVELKKFRLDFLAKDSSGNYLISSLIRGKLPEFYLLEMCRREMPYPKLEDLLEKIPDICKILRGQGNYPKTTDQRKDQARGVKSEQQSAKGNKPNNYNTINSTRTFAHSSEVAKSCKFCKSANHRSSTCNAYSSHNARIERARALALCVRCLSPKHKEEACFGNQGKLPFQCFSCKTATHVTPMCPQVASKNRDNKNSA